MKHLLHYALACALAGCSILTSPGSYEGGESVDAEGVLDTGPDLSEPDARSACTTPCIDPEPHCDEGTARCVACLDNTHCANGGECMGGRCPECEMDVDCTRPEAPVCSRTGDTTGQCIPCDRDMDCDGIRASDDVLGVCDRPADGPNVCVECNGGADECNSSFVCDLRARECSVEVPMSAGRCFPCVASAQCAAGRVCAEEIFGGMATGFHCLRESVLGCATPGIEQSSSWWTIEGERVGVCHPGNTTCQGYRDDSARCTDDTACGLPGIVDAVCELPMGRCTFTCGADIDCLGSDTCSSGTPRVCVE